MPLFKTIETTGFRLGIWRITETEEELLSGFPEAEFYRKEAFLRFKKDSRKREFAAVRALLHRMEPNAGIITYFANGRPCLSGSGLCLSISHTRDYAAVILSSYGTVGVDIERCTERVMAVRHRIVSLVEQAETCTAVLLHWSAKETVFKMMDCEGVDFLNHLCVRGLSQVNVTSEPQRGNSFQVIASHPLCHCTYDVRYWACEDFVLTYSLQITENKAE